MNESDGVVMGGTGQVIWAELFPNSSHWLKPFTTFSNPINFANFKRRGVGFESYMSYDGKT